MNDFLLGVEHITDWKGYDHMLFLLALVAWANLKDALKVLLLATAFTVGHTVTLMLAGMGWFRPDGDWIEFLIPVSIAATALINLSPGTFHARSWSHIRYGLTVFFGLIHGLGFSSYFRMMSDGGDSIIGPLLRFNLGVEAGQAMLLLGYLAFATLLQAVGVRARELQVFICGATFAVALFIAWERLPF